MKEKIIQVLQEQLQSSESIGIDQLSFSVLIREKRGVSVYQQEVDSIEISDSISIGIMLGHQKKWSCSLVESSDPNSISNAIKQAKQTMEFVDSDGDIVLSKPVEHTLRHCPDLAIKELSIDEIKNETIITDKKTWDYDKRIENVAYTGMISDIMTRIYMNSNGQNIIEENSLLHVSSSVAARGNDGKLSNYYSSNSFINRNDFNIESRVNQTGEEVLSRLDQKQIESKKYKIIFDQKTSAQLLSTFATVFYGDSLYKKITRLSDQLDHKIASEKVSIIDEPYSGLVPHYFDGEGTLTQKVSIVDQGVFKNFLHNLYTAKKTGQVHTGHATPSMGMLPTVSHSNMRWDGELDSAHEIIENLDEGLFIKEIQGASVSAISGDFSYGASGQYIKNGKVVYPIADFTIAGNIFDLLKSIVRVGDDLKYFFPKSTGSVGGRTLLVDSLMVSG